LHLDCSVMDVFVQPSNQTVAQVDPTRLSRMNQCMHDLVRATKHCLITPTNTGRELRSLLKWDLWA
jgi:hypothetical protein